MAAALSRKGREVRAFKGRTTGKQPILISKPQETTYSLGDTCMGGVVRGDRARGAGRGRAHATQMRALE